MKTIEVTLHIDSNQSWLQVGKNWLKELYIENHISNMSRMNSDQVYLSSVDREQFEKSAQESKWHLVYNTISWEINAPCNSYRTYVPFEIRQY